MGGGSGVVGMAARAWVVAAAAARPMAVVVTMVRREGLVGFMGVERGSGARVRSRVGEGPGSSGRP